MFITHRRFTLALLAIGLAGSVAGAQTYYTPGYTLPPVPAYAPPSAPAPLAPAQLDQLLAPIALYPDPLLSEVLAGATYPQDVAAAAQWLQYFPSPSEEDINAQPWDPSVKALVHYPTVLNMMASQPDWTAALGSAFANQPQDVMNEVQRLRSEALAAGTLVNTPQQQIVNDAGTIEILPAQPEVIYVPEYNPDDVYVAHPGVYQPWITFGVPWGIGGWLDLDWDWHHHRIDEGVRWGHDWGHPDFGHEREWHHDPGRPIPERPRGVEPRGENRGWSGGHSGGAFDVHQGGRPEAQPAPHRQERPVKGMPEHPQPGPRAAEPGRAGAPVRPVEPARPVAPPRPMEPVRPVAPARPAPPSRPIEEHGNRIAAPAAPAPAIHERPVQGIPHEAPRAPAQIHSEPARGGPSGPPSAFHGGGGASIQSSRGNASMGHR